jgi:hypothetical protein
MPATGKQTIAGGTRSVGLCDSGAVANNGAIIGLSKANLCRGGTFGLDKSHNMYDGGWLVRSRVVSRSCCEQRAAVANQLQGSF